MTRTARCRLGIVVGLLALTASWVEARYPPLLVRHDTGRTRQLHPQPHAGKRVEWLPGTHARELDGWRMVVQQMLQGSCDATLPQSLAGVASRRPFVDSGNGKAYCVLMEVLDADDNGVVDRGWGTFIVDPDAVREISHQAPHPLSDIATDTQAIGALQGQRLAQLSDGWDAPQRQHRGRHVSSAYRVSDVAHDAATMFQAANEAMSVCTATATGGPSSGTAWRRIRAAAWRSISRTARAWRP